MQKIPGKNMRILYTLLVVLIALHLDTCYVTKYDCTQGNWLIMIIIIIFYIKYTYIKCW